MTRIAAILLVVFAAPASATTILYTSRADWEAAVPDFFVDGLESYGAHSTTGGRIALGPFDFVVPFNHGSIGTCWVYPDDPSSCNNVDPPSPPNLVLRGDVHMDSEGSYNDLEFHQMISWFAVDFLYVEDEINVDVTILGESFEAFTGTFLGVISDVPFSTIHITGDRLFYVVDNVSYPASAAIPEPMSAMLLGIGLIGLGCIRWRRARAALAEPGSSGSGL
jgi:hypothetical protein